LTVLLLYWRNKTSSAKCRCFELVILWNRWL